MLPLAEISAHADTRRNAMFRGVGKRPSSIYRIGSRSSAELRKMRTKP
jgi:hypothetical protein